MEDSKDPLGSHVHSSRAPGNDVPCVGLKGCVVWCSLQLFLTSSSSALWILRSLSTTNRHGSTAKLGGLLALKIALNKEGNDSKFSCSRKQQHNK